MEIANAEFGAFDVNWEIDLGAPGKVLDIAVSAVFRTAWDRAGTFTPDFLFDF